MPYSGIADHPRNLRSVLPGHAREIIVEGFNNVLDENADPERRRGDASREETARVVAWSSVKSRHEQGEDSEWHQK